MDYCGYFKQFDIYKQKYKSKSILLMQVGSFHEAYQTDIDGEGCDLDIISDITGAIKTKKNKSKSVTKGEPYMLGFPSHTLNKFIKLLVDEDYTVIVEDQFPDLPKLDNKVQRKLTGVYSKGTYIEDLKSDSNFIMSIYIEEIEEYPVKNLILFSGISLVDISTGQIFINEISSTKNDEKYSLDDTVRFINSYNPSEIILYTNNLKSINEDKLVQYLEMTNRFYHIKKYNKEFNKISYQKKLLQKIYDDTIEELNLDKYIYARYSFISLINFIEEHNENMILKLKEPELIEKEKYLYLGNNVLQQLNIFGTETSSLYNIINFCSTALGKRFLKETLVNPLLDIKKINNRYEMIGDFKKKGYEQIEVFLSQIYDVERFSRKIALKTIHPMELYKWYLSITSIISLKEYIDKHKYKVHTSYDLDELKNCIQLVNDTISIDEASKYNINEIETNIFKKGVVVELDELSNKIELCKNLITIIRNKLNDIMNEIKGEKFKSKSNANTDNIKIESTDRDGYYLQMTKTRADVLKAELDKIKTIQIENMIIKTDTFIYKTMPGGSTTKIFIPDVNKKSEELIKYICMMKLKSKDHYQQFLDELYTTYRYIMDEASYYVSIIDFIKSGAKCSDKYYYNKPKIVLNDDKSFIDTKNIRHPIVERINQNQAEYKPMNVKIGVNNLDGMLLYGLNSAGKSTLQKSVGINLILAQIGYYVSAESFEYYPYNSLFTRISGNDNLFKGLSSFALEIVELSGILKRSGKNTLVIADEVCRGTEYKSSIVIVMTMIEILSKSRTSFITATHLHKLTKLDRMKQITNVKPYHIHISYDEKTNTLVYDRELREGVGEEFYGLNVAKCLINDSTFIETANEIRKEIDSKKTLSRYNKRLEMERCSVCSHIPDMTETSLETHHIIPQKDYKNKTNEKKHINMNSIPNLCVLCQKCHDDVDRGNLIIGGYVETSTGLKLEYHFPNSIHSGRSLS